MAPHAAHVHCRPPLGCRGTSAAARCKCLDMLRSSPNLRTFNNPSTMLANLLTLACSSVLRHGRKNEHRNGHSRVSRVFRLVCWRACTPADHTTRDFMMVQYCRNSDQIEFQMLISASITKLKTDTAVLWSCNHCACERGNSPATFKVTSANDAICCQLANEVLLRAGSCETPQR